MRVVLVFNLKKIMTLSVDATDTPREKDTRNKGYLSSEFDIAYPFVLTCIFPSDRRFS